MTGGAIIIGGIHMMAAVILVGGSFFLDRIIGPPADSSDTPEIKKLMQSAGQRFSVAAWIALILLIGTGFVRMGGKVATMGMNNLLIPLSRP